MKRCALITCLVLVLPLAKALSQDSISVVSHKRINSKKNPIRNSRFYISPGEASSVFIFGSGRLGKSIRKIKLKDSDFIASRNKLKKNISKSLDSTYALINDTSLYFTTIPLTEKSYERSKKYYLRGLGNNTYFKNQWIHLGSFQKSVKSSTRIKIRRSFFTSTKYNVETLPSADVEELFPLVENKCYPKDLEFLKVRKMQGFGPLNIKYKLIKRRLRNVERKTFDLYFDANETIPQAAGVKNVIDFLTNNELEILGCEIDGGYSIEGSSEKNSILMQARGKYLKTVFKKHYNKTLRKDTIYYNGPFSLFKNQIKGTQFEWLDSLTHENLIDTINQSIELRNLLEPFFKQQRKAVLKLAMARPISKDEFATATVINLSILVNKYLKKAETSLAYEPELAGNVLNILEARRNGEFTLEEVDSILSKADPFGLCKTIAGFLILREYEFIKQKRNREALDEWKNKFKESGEEYLLLMGNAACIRFLQQKKTMAFWGKYIKILTDYQTYAFELINDKLLPIEYYCLIDYPADERFWRLAVSNYTFLYLKSQEGEDVWCIGDYEPEFITFRKAKKERDKLGLNEIVIKDSEVIKKIGERYYKPQTYLINTPSPWYIISKKYILSLKKKTNSPVYLSNTSDLPFHVYMFFKFSLDMWNPLENVFYDPEITLQELSDLASLFHKNKGIVCSQDAEKLLLDYYLKVLRHLQYNGSPGNPKETKIANQAFLSILKFYKGYDIWIPKKYGMILSQQLVTFESVPANISGANIAYQIYSSIAKRRLLDEEEVQLFIKLIKLYDPKVKNKYGPFLSKEAILKRIK